MVVVVVWLVMMVDVVGGHYVHLGTDGLRGLGYDVCGEDSCCSRLLTVFILDGENFFKTESYEAYYDPI